MGNFFLRSLYYFFYDLLKIVINLNKKYHYIIFIPRLLSLIIKKVLIFDKNNNVFFYQYVRNYNDILTVYEIFSEEHYNLKKLEISKDLLKFFGKNSFNKNPLIVDCGSNIGSSSLYFSKQFKNCSIIALEPDKDNFEFCKNNIKGNNFYLFNNAISNMEQTVGFTPNYVDSRASKISNDNKNKIKCLTVNNILAEFNSVNYFPYLIKIDIEGYEKNLFIDNYEWLDKFKIVIIELHDWMLPTEGNSFNFLRALTDIMVKKKKRDLILSGENLISIRIDE